MSKVEQLKKQYPNLSISFVELAKLLDNTKSHKYTPVICKIINEFFSYNRDDDFNEKFSYLVKKFDELGLSYEGLSIEQMFIYKLLIEHIYPQIDLIQDLINFGERNLLPTKDILKFKNIEQIKRDITIASLRDSEKNFSEQVYKEFENDTWLILRPLTYESSIKYGASTKWCTTSRHEKEYFARYWDRGVLVYFINKTNGYKFAGYKGVKNNDELSFWSSEDNRIDSLDIECDSYLYDIIKNIFKSDKSNSDLCGFEMKLKVSSECKYICYDEQESRVLAPLEQIMVDYRIRNVQENNNITLTNPDDVVVDTTYVANAAFTTPTVSA